MAKGVKEMRRSTYKLVLLMLLLVAAACEQEANENTPATAMPATPVAETAVSATTAPASNERVQITSPDGEIIVKFSLQEGVPYYAVDVSGQPVINPSRLGFVFKEGEPLDQKLCTRH